MINNYTDMIDMQISHSQLHIYNGNYDQENAEWGDGNVEQGAILHESHLVFDPIIRESFKARVFVKISDSYTRNENSLRAIVANIRIKEDGVHLFSVPGTQKLKTKFNTGGYTLYFEECEREDVDELFFVITFVESNSKIEPRYLQDDPWGGVKGRKLKLGKF